MNPFRILLSMFLGLVLLVQGFAVSAAPRAKLSEGTPASASVMVDMPCHAQMAMKQDDSGKQERSCCNASCPDMTTCALGHLAAATLVTVSVPPAAQAESRVTPVRIEARTLNSPLRPPIASHG